MKMVARLALVLTLALAAGCDNDDGSAKCEEVKSLLTSCYDTRCEDSDSHFCQCWSQGQDLNVLSCSCVERQENAVCEVYNLESFTTAGFSCGNAMDYLNSQCVDSPPIATPTDDASSTPDTSADDATTDSDAGPEE